MSVEVDRSAAPGVFQGRVDRILTDRLDVAPLSRNEAELYLTDVAEYASALGLAETPQEPEQDMRAAFNWLVDVSLRLDSSNYVYGSIWALVDRERRVHVGAASFKGEPIAGDAEIAYGVDARYRRRGYMTEALRGFVAWGRARADLRGIVAETLKENAASQRCLIGAGFEHFGEFYPEDDAFFWRIDVSGNESIMAGRPS